MLKMLKNAHLPNKKSSSQFHFRSISSGGNDKIKSPFLSFVLPLFPKINQREILICIQHCLLILMKHRLRQRLRNPFITSTVLIDFVFMRNKYTY